MGLFSVTVLGDCCYEGAARGAIGGDRWRLRGCDTRPASSSVAYTASYDGKRLEVVEENRWQDALHSHKVVYNVSSSFRSIFCRRQGA